MIAPIDGCLNESQQTAFAQGRLGDADFADALEHLEACESCQKAVQAHPEPLRFIWAELRSAADEQPLFQAEPECQATVGNILLQAPDEPIASSNEKQSIGSDLSLPIVKLGPYRLMSPLGEGGMGAVYLAEHERLKRHVAIKILARDKLRRPGWLDRFNREMTAIAALEHPNIIRATDAGEVDKWHYLVMEYLDGLDLGKICRRITDISIGSVCEIIRQVALGLQAIHDASMIHRDIKPSNIFVTRNGQVKILDLGLVLDGDSPLSIDERLTTVGHMMGTVPYMAREQLNDPRQADHRADIYSLGATMFRLFAKKPPFGSDRNLAKTIQAISQSPAVSISAMVQDLPSDIAKLVDEMLSVNPDQRPASAREIAERLEPFADSDGPKKLVGAALRVQEPDETSPTGLSNPMANPVQSSRSRSSFPYWIAACLLPFAFAGGIFLTLTTDRGTLVIQSDENAIQVKVTRGGTLVEQLQIEQTQPAMLRLKSGRYTVELTGVESDQLKISDQQVTLMRGDRQVVQITRRDEGSPLVQSKSTIAQEAKSSSSNAKRFQGKTLAEWMVILDQDQDVQAIGQAMQAVGSLVSTQEEKSSAARSCLVHARNLGGYGIGNEKTEISSGSDRTVISKFFVRDLFQAFPRFSNIVGFQAIADELEQNSYASGTTCILLLSHLLPGFGNSDQPAGRTTLQEIKNTSEGMALLRKLDQGLKSSIEVVQRRYEERFQSQPSQLKKETVSSTTVTALQERLEICRMIGSDVTEDVQLIAYAERMADSAKWVWNEYYVNPNTKSIPLPMDVEQAIFIAEILGFDGYLCQPLVLSWLVGERFSINNPKAKAHLESLASSNPTAIIEAVEVYLRHLLSSSGPQEASEVVAFALDVFGRHHPQPQKAFALIADSVFTLGERIRNTMQPIQSAFRRLVARAVVETDLGSDLNATSIMAYASGVFQVLGLPDEQAEQVIRKFLVYGSERDPWSMNEGQNITQLSELRSFTASTANKKKTAWNDATFFLHWMKVVLQKPKIAIATFLELFRDNNTSSTARARLAFSILDPINATLTAQTDPQQKMEVAKGEERVHEALQAFLFKEEGRIAVREIALQIDVELAELLRMQAAAKELHRLEAAAKESTSTENKIDPRDSIYSYVYQRLELARFLKADILESPALCSAIRYIHERKNFHLDLVLLEAEVHVIGVAQYPMVRLIEAVKRVSGRQKIAPRIVQSLYQARPDEFRETVLKFLRDLADKPIAKPEESNDDQAILGDEAKADKNLVARFFHVEAHYGQPPDGGSLWSSIVRVLRSDPKSREEIDKIVLRLASLVDEERIKTAITRPLQL